MATVWLSGCPETQAAGCSHSYMPKFTLHQARADLGDSAAYADNVACQLPIIGIMLASAAKTPGLPSVRGWLCSLLANSPRGSIINTTSTRPRHDQHHVHKLLSALSKLSALNKLSVHKQLHCEQRTLDGHIQAMIQQAWDDAHRVRNFHPANLPSCSERTARKVLPSMQCS